MFNQTMRDFSRQNGVMTSPLLNNARNNPDQTATNIIRQRRVQPTSEQSAAQATLPYRSQVVAMSLCYRRLVCTWLAPPLLCVLLPLCLRATCFGCNIVSNGYGVPLLIASVLLTKTWYRLIDQTAPDQEKRKIAYEKSAGVVPTIMFVISAMLMRFVIAPFVERVPVVAQGIRWLSTMSIGSGLRLPMGAALLGIAVLSKYVGPVSFGKFFPVHFVCIHHLIVLPTLFLLFP